MCFTGALQQIQARAGAVGGLDWQVQIGSTTVRAHQYAADTGRGWGRYGHDETDDHAPSADSEAG